MRVELGFLETKVARRLLFLFVFCAVLPVGALATVSYRQVARHLRAQHEARVAEVVRDTESLLTERLQVADAELEVLARVLELPEVDETRVRQITEAATSFSAVALDRGTRTPEMLRGRLASLPELEDRDRAHLDTGRPVLALVRNPQGAPDLLVARALGNARAPQTVVWARLRSGFLWDGLDLAPLPESDLLIVDDVVEPVVG
ncbi:MAG: hypothetical protein KC645_16180, partial [Gemmatimonadetes bacterium]|nr:hypothetical protein [Gemmatimonadota bacterium]